MPSGYLWKVFLKAFDDDAYLNANLQSVLKATAINADKNNNQLNWRHFTPYNIKDSMATHRKFKTPFKTGSRSAVAKRMDFAPAGSGLDKNYHFTCLSMKTRQFSYITSDENKPANSQGDPIGFKASREAIKLFLHCQVLCCKR
jgi:hypothetical protein